MALHLTTSLYAALAALLYVAITIRVIKARTTHKVLLLDGGIDAVSREVRAHANFAEYVPFILFLMLLAELQGADAWMIHIIGAVTLIGRISHYYSLTCAEPAAAKEGELNLRFRMIGMMSTFAALVASAALLLIGYFF